MPQSKKFINWTKKKNCWNEVPGVRPWTVHAYVLSVITEDQQGWTLRRRVGGELGQVKVRDVEMRKGLEKETKKKTGIRIRWGV